MPKKKTSAVTDAKTLRAAEQFIERFGDNASREAARRAQELSAHGDSDGAAMWTEIAQIARSLLQCKPPAGETEH